MASSRSTRAPRRAASEQLAQASAPAGGISGASTETPTAMSSEQALQELLNPHFMAAAPEPAEPVLEPPEREYVMEIRLAQAALSGDSAYHVMWPESRIRTLLSGAISFVPAPVRPHLPGQAAPDAARFVYIQNIAEVIIHGWPRA